jgi:tetratricopeptide (TPR) repeat protein
MILGPAQMAARAVGSSLMAQKTSARSAEWLCGLAGRLRLAAWALIVLMPWAAVGAADSPENLLREVQKLIEGGQLALAEQKLEAGLQAFPDDPRLSNAHGIVSAQRGDFVAAESQFRKAIELAPHFTDALLNLGRLYQQSPDAAGAAQKAIAAYETIVSYEPDQVEANYQLAVLLESQGSYEKSQARLARLPEAAQQRAQALSVRCANLAGMGDTDAAEKAAQDLLRAQGLSELDVTSILPVLDRAGRTDLAVVLLEGLQTRQLASAASLRQLGLGYERAGKLQNARDSLEKAAPGFRDDLGPLLRDLARVAYKQKDYKGALGYLAHARELAPNDASIHFFFGIVCLDAELLMEARNSLQKAVELAPDQPYYNYALGAVMTTQRNAGNAVPYVEKFLSMKPGDKRGRLLLGIAYYRTADYEKARPELEAVADDEVTAAAANYFLGRIELRNNDLEKAARRLQQAIHHAPDYSDAYADLGLVYIRQSEYDAAEKVLAKAIGMDPNGYRTNLNLLLLYERTKDPRAGAQKQKFDRLQKEQEEKLELVMRTIEVQPY